MSTFIIDDIRNLGNNYFSKNYKFASAESLVLNESKSQSQLKAYDIFLSHSFKDAELVLGLKIKLESYGYSVYIDWIEDNQLSREKVTKDTADIIL